MKYKYEIDMKYFNKIQYNFKIEIYDRKHI